MSHHQQQVPGETELPEQMFWFLSLTILSYLPHSNSLRSNEEVHVCNPEAKFKGMTLNKSNIHEDILTLRIYEIG